jgi:hypothetical protein
MEEQLHKKIHIELHQKLDELVADFIFETGSLPSKTSISELMQWSFEQTKKPNKIQSNAPKQTK